MDSDTKLMQLYEAVRNGQVTTDEEAFRLLYPASDDRNAFYKLKHVLVERLLNTVFFIDTKQRKFSDNKRAYLESQKMLHLLNLLNVRGAKKNAIAIGEKALRLALKYEFTHEIITIARRLTGYYASLVGDRKRLQELHQLIEDHLQLYMQETLAENYYQKIISLYVNERSTKTEVYEQAGRYLAELAQYPGKRRSSNLVYFITMLEVTQYMSVNDYRRTIDICRRGIDFFEHYRFLNTRAYFAMSMQYLACCLPLRKYCEGTRLVQRLLGMVDAGSLNWFKIMEVHFTLALHMGQYDEAAQIYQRAGTHRRYRALPANFREIWVIYGAWIYLLQQQGWVQGREDSKEDFRIYKYLNEVPTFAKDKRGLNVSILVSQIMILLQQSKYDCILDRLEAIKKYRGRYLHATYHLRSYLFIRMLSQVPAARFQREKVIERTRCLAAQLSATPIEAAHQRHDLEILPYEVAWQLLLEMLEDKGRQ